jgi:acyl-CoA reductase-like NAD-dependent aldehyde dehydrogenase
MTERAETDAIQGSTSIEEIDQDIDTGIGLGIDVEHRLGQGLEEFGQERNRLPFVDERSGHFFLRHRGNVAIDTTGAQEIRIVERYEMSVTGDLNIRFEVSETDIGRSDEGSKRVLGKTLESPTMGECDEGVVGVRVEERMLVPKLHENIQTIVERRWNAIRRTQSKYDHCMWQSIESSRLNGSPLLVPLAGQLWSNGEQREIRSPYDGSLIASVPLARSADVERAVASARGALKRGLAAWERAEILDRAARSLMENREDFARIVCEESAKPIRTARVEVDRAVSTFQFSAAEARTLVGEVVPMDASTSGAGRLGFTLRVPIGVIGAIAPFNFPLNLVAHKIGPAIAAGCPVVLKPASQTPLTSIALATMLIENCGLPIDWIHVVPGPGSEIGDALVDHPDIALVTFTGSPDVGWSIRSRAPKKRVGLELGNNAPVIIEPDGDWKSAVAKIRTAGFSHAGQSCISTQRILVHASIAQTFTEALVAEVSSIVVGDPREESTEMSSLISQGERVRVQSWIDEAVDQGARILFGGVVSSDGILGPTVLDNVHDEMKVSRCEVFGPVVVISPYDDLSEALRAANDSDFGLQAGIFTSRVDSALRAVRELDFGGVVINDVPTYRADQQPYGGLRDSGNTREGPSYSVREMTEIRMVVINP